LPPYVAVTPTCRHDNNRARASRNKQTAQQTNQQ
jgi:hypothetical protein